MRVAHSRGMRVPGLIQQCRGAKVSPNSNTCWRSHHVVSKRVASYRANSHSPPFCRITLVCYASLHVVHNRSGGCSVVCSNCGKGNARKSATFQGVLATPVAGAQALPAARENRAMASTADPEKGQTSWPVVPEAGKNTRACDWKW